MSTPTATPATFSPPPPRPTGSTPGARLAAASRHAQGLPSKVNDPAVLAELRGLCAAPRSTARAVTGAQESPAP